MRRIGFANVVLVSVVSLLAQPGFTQPDMPSRFVGVPTQPTLNDVPECKARPRHAYKGCIYDQCCMARSGTPQCSAAPRTRLDTRKGFASKDIIDRKSDRSMCEEIAGAYFRVFDVAYKELQEEHRRAEREQRDIENARIAQERVDAERASKVATQLKQQERLGRLAAVISGRAKPTNCLEHFAARSGRRAVLSDGIDGVSLQPTQRQHYFVGRIKSFENGVLTIWQEGSTAATKHYVYAVTDRSTSWIEQSSMKIESGVFGVGTYVENTRAQSVAGASLPVAVVRTECVEPVSPAILGDILR